MHKKKTWEIIRGDTETVRLHLQEYPPAKNGGNLTLTIRTQPDTPKIISKSVSVTGKDTFTIELSPEETRKLGGWYTFDIEFKTKQGKVKTFVLGDIHAKKDITYEG